MTLKYVLTLKTTSSPHLYLDQLKALIAKDSYLLPATRGYLNFMKKTKRSFIPLPLQSEVLISPEHQCNLTRGLSPQLTEFNIVFWTDSDKKKYSNNAEKFIADILKLYSKMGYEVKENIAPENEIIQKLIDDFNSKGEKLKNLINKDK